MAGIDDLIGGLAGSEAGGSGGSGGLEDILGGILGSGGSDSSPGGGLEDILGGILGGGGQTSGASGGSAGLGGMIAILAPLIGTLLKNGGLSKILSGMQANGLSAQADSWVGTGTNEAISGTEVRQALGEDEVAQVAAELGVDPDQASEVLAGVLPGLVNTVTPDGQVPSDDELDRFADAFAGLGASPS